VLNYPQGTQKSGESSSELCVCVCVCVCVCGGGGGWGGGKIEKGEMPICLYVIRKMI